MDSAIRCTGKPEVLVVTIAPGLRNCATRDSKFLLISRFSATTSMIQSASAQRAKSSSKFPIETFSASAGVKNAAGFDFFAASSPARTILLRSPAGAPGFRSGGTISNKMHGSPALAKCAAIREPMVPAPNTAAFSIRRFMAYLFRALLNFETSGQVTKPLSPGQTNYGPAARRALQYCENESWQSDGRHRVAPVCKRQAALAGRARGAQAHGAASRRPRPSGRLRARHCPHWRLARSTRGRHTHRFGRRHERWCPHRRGFLRRHFSRGNGAHWHYHELHRFRPMDAFMAWSRHQSASGKISRQIHFGENFRGDGHSSGDRHDRYQCWRLRLLHAWPHRSTLARVVRLSGALRAHSI